MLLLIRLLNLSSTSITAGQGVVGNGGTASSDFLKNMSYEKVGMHTGFKSNRKRPYVYRWGLTIVKKPQNKVNLDLQQRQI